MGGGFPYSDEPAKAADDRLLDGLLAALRLVQYPHLGLGEAVRLEQQLLHANRVVDAAFKLGARARVAGVERAIDKARHWYSEDTGSRGAGKVHAVTVTPPPS